MNTAPRFFRWFLSIKGWFKEGSFRILLLVVFASTFVTASALLELVNAIKTATMIIGTISAMRFASGDKICLVTIRT